MNDNYLVKRTIGATLLGIAVLLLFASVLVGQSASEENVNAEATLNWKNIPATILTSKLVKVPGSVVGPDMRHMFRAENPPTFAPVITYEVQDGKTTFVSEGISHPPPSFTDEALATEFLQQFQPGQQVTVSQNPKDLHETLLIPGFNAMVKKINRLSNVCYVATFLLAIIAFAIFPDKKAFFQGMIQSRT